MRIAVSRTRPPDFAEHVAKAVGGELVPLGSAGYKTLAVVRGEVDAYVHGGGQWEWDVARLRASRCMRASTCRASTGRR